MDYLTVVGGGLAGCEAAWQAAQRGIKVLLYEMRPIKNTGAHVTDQLAELVCSNSFGSKLPDRATGVLQDECRFLLSLIIKCAEESQTPAGSALAVDRGIFSKIVQTKISNHPNITVERKEIVSIPEGPAIIATGPLTSSALARSIIANTGQERLFFFDAIAPIVTLESINMDIAFRASRFNRGEQNEGDYINCPFTKDQYDTFVNELVNATRIPLEPFEDDIDNGVQAGEKTYFEGCLPVEVLASRGHNSLAFGPMRPVGLHNPNTGKRPYAALQLRQDNLAGSLYNLVGFQTNLIFSEQKRVFQLIPGLENAEFIRYGQMHRNTFIASPNLLDPTMQLRSRKDLFFAGQITGIEGYVGSIATGLIAGVNAARVLHNQEPVCLPITTMIGALIHYITHASMQDFQPMKANFGILPELDHPDQGKKKRAVQYAERARNDIRDFIFASQLVSDVMNDSL